MTGSAGETCSISYVQREGVIRYPMQLGIFILHWNVGHCKIDNCYAIEQVQSFVNMLLVGSN